MKNFFNTGDLLQISHQEIESKPFQHSIDLSLSTKSGMPNILRSFQLDSQGKRFGWDLLEGKLPAFSETGPQQFSQYAVHTLGKFFLFIDLNDLDPRDRSAFNRDQHYTSTMVARKMPRRRNGFHHETRYDYSVGLSCY